VSKAQEHRLKARKASQNTLKAVKRSRVGEQAKISVTEPGLYYLKASEISAVLGMPEQRVRNMIRQTSLSLSNQARRWRTLRMTVLLHLFLQSGDRQHV